MAKKNQYRNEKDCAPGYEDFKSQMRMNSPILNKAGVAKSTTPDAMGAVMSLSTKRGKEAHLQQIIIRVDDNADLQDAGFLQRAEHTLAGAEKLLTSLNEERKIKGLETVTASQMPADRRAEKLAYCQANNDTLLEERDWLRKDLKRIEEQEQEEAKQDQIKKKYEGTIEGYHWNDQSCPRQVDGRAVKRNDQGEAIFEDDGEKVGDYMVEVRRRKQAIFEQRKENEKVMKERNLDKRWIPFGVQRGTKSIHNWLAKHEVEQASA